MSKITGICRNEECGMCDQIQEAEKSNFVCQECGKELFPIEGDRKGSGAVWRKKHGMQVVFAVIAIAIVGGGAFGIVTALSDSDGLAQPAAKERSAKQPANPVSVSEKSTMTPMAQVTPQSGEAAMLPTEAAPRPTKTASKAKGTQQKNNIAPQPQNGYGHIDLGYGTYVGDLKDGQPHGHGTITYTQTHRIVSSKDFMAQPGDRFEGDFREGKICSIGYWYHNGEQTAIKP